jgi:hypothetical protein
MQAAVYKGSAALKIEVLHKKVHLISHACFKYVIFPICIDNLCKLNIKFAVKPFPGNSI